MSEQGKEKAALAYMLDQIVYSDSYGVHGSDFAACHLCHGGGAPGVPLVHEDSCPVARFGAVAQEWWDEQNENLLEIASLRAQLADARALNTKAEEAVAEDLGEMLSLRAKLEKAMTALHASAGYLRNADIDLSTGAPKKTAQTTIRGGIKLIETALADIGNAASLTDEQSQVDDGNDLTNDEMNKGGSFQP